MKIRRTNPTGKVSVKRGLSKRLRELLAREFTDTRRAVELFDEFLEVETYDRSFSLKLLKLARGRASWEIRRLAVLMLEHQILNLAPDQTDEHDLLLTRLKLKPARGREINLHASLLKEGYTTTQLQPFILEFRRRLARLNRAHEPLCASRVSDGAWRDFISLSRQDCKLTLARYVFSPTEVVEEILSRVEVSKGVRDSDPLQSSLVETEAAAARRLMPDYEAEILRQLCQSSKIYWVGSETSSELNALVEYPLTTVVLVVKPPGSDMEFEIKRAGRRGKHLLNVVFRRNGYQVAVSHRLDGGSIGYLLRWESNGASTLSNIYRTVHRTEPPVPKYHTRTSVYAVPLEGREQHLLDYFSDARVFGTSYDELHRAMAEAIAAFRKEDKSHAPALPGDVGRCVEFLYFASPSQSIISGTSSFRLDKLAAYLSDDGAHQYFKDGLRVAYRNDDARRFADTLLEEILGVYEPPHVRFQTYGQYVKAAFAVKANRARAARYYLSAMAQIGSFWGTLLAIRGHSWGESFVGRNVGLKSVWEGGEWKVRLIFMDHDNLHLADEVIKYFRPQYTLPGVFTDERFIVGRSTKGRESKSEVFYLKEIYRSNARLRKQGRALMQEALKDAYRKTLDEAVNHPDIRRFFNSEFVARMKDWDRVVGNYLRMQSNGSHVEAWKKRERAFLRRRGYDRAVVDSYFKAVERYRGFFDKYSFLYL